MKKPFSPRAIRCTLSALSVNPCGWSSPRSPSCGVPRLNLFNPRRSYMHTRRLRLISVLSFIFLALAELAYAQTPLRLEPVSPCRLVDTRTQNGGSGPIQGGTAQNFNLPQLAELGKFCPAFSLSAAAAYSLNVTLVPVNGGPVAYLTIWPTGETQPVVSLMNSLDGRIKANAAIVPAGASGQVSVYVTNTTNVLLDINAYFDSASDDAALAFFPLTPCRVVD